MKIHMQAMIALLVLLAMLILLGQSQASDIYLESGGLVVGEAEAFSRRTNIGSAGWVVKPTENNAVDTANGGPIISNARGGAYIQSLPNQTRVFYLSLARRLSTIFSFRHRARTNYSYVGAGRIFAHQNTTRYLLTSCS